MRIRKQEIRNAGNKTLPTTGNASMTFLWGCQEQPSSPVGPECSDILLNRAPHDHGGGGGGGGDPTSTLDFAEGMETEGLAVTVTDRKNLLKAENTDFVHPIQMNFSAPGTCVGFKGTKSGVLPSTDGDPSEFDLLVDELTSPVTG